MNLQNESRSLLYLGCVPKGDVDLGTASAWLRVYLCSCWNVEMSAVQKLFVEILSRRPSFVSAIGGVDLRTGACT